MICITALIDNSLQDQGLVQISQNDSKKGANKQQPQQQPQQQQGQQNRQAQVRHPRSPQPQAHHSPRHHSQHRAQTTASVPRHLNDSIYPEGDQKSHQGSDTQSPAPEHPHRRRSGKANTASPTASPLNRHSLRRSRSRSELTEYGAWQEAVKDSPPAYAKDRAYYLGLPPDLKRRPGENVLGHERPIEKIFGREHDRYSYPAVRTSRNGY